MATSTSTASWIMRARQDDVHRRWWSDQPGSIWAEPAVEVGGAAWNVVPGSMATVLAAYRLQDIADYRSALQRWFEALRIGGHLIVIVPHAFLYERRLALPGRWHPAQRRLYTPRSLLDEVEEALAPNSYRVRRLADDDEGYDYARSPVAEPAGHCDVVLILERITPPAWSLAAVPREAPLGDEPDYGFEPARTRVETATTRPHARILILKLDHLGDFIMSIAALQKLRRLFAGSHITLVVGSWNAEMARELAIADQIVTFDVFPRNSSEEEVDVAGKTALFHRLIHEGEFDLAIDMRTDTDTRPLLRNVPTRLRAGIGTRAEFPFLDIFLPLDFNRNEPETASEQRFNHHDFASQSGTVRHDHRMVAPADALTRDCAIVWGPYRRLRAGRYLFEPYLELAPEQSGLLMLDIALDAVRAASLIVGIGDDGSTPPRLSFEVERPDSEFEFRIWGVDGADLIDFNFFGGRLIREGAASVLHQSEYQSLLVQLVWERVTTRGLLADAATA